MLPIERHGSLTSNAALGQARPARGRCGFRHFTSHAVHLHSRQTVLALRARKHLNISMKRYSMDSALQRQIELLHAEVCQALADPKRIALLYTLDKGPQCVNDLAAALHVPQPTVSYHLRVLRERGLATAEPDGTTVYYSLADRRIIQALDTLRAMLADSLVHQAELLRRADDTAPIAQGG